MHATETGVKYAGILSDQMLKPRRIAWSGQHRSKYILYFWRGLSKGYERLNIICYKLIQLIRLLSEGRPTFKIAYGLSTYKFYLPRYMIHLSTSECFIVCIPKRCCKHMQIILSKDCYHTRHQVGLTYIDQ